MMNDVLTVRNLTKTYPAFTLDGVSFTVKAGSITGFIGRNGAGKTTTLKSLLNLVHPDSGEVCFFGLPWAGNEETIKPRIGFASGGTDWYPRKTVGQLARQTAVFYPDWDGEAYRKYLSLFALDERKQVRELSEGMRVKFSLLLALSHHAEFLLLDEPTSGLDPVSRDELLTVFRGLADEGVAILFSTHITSDLDKCADAITYIKNGRIVASEQKAAFIAAYGGGTLEEIMLQIEKGAAT